MAPFEGHRNGATAGVVVGVAYSGASWAPIPFDRGHFVDFPELVPTMPERCPGFPW